MAIFEILNFDFGQFEQLSSLKITKIQTPESLKLLKMTFLDCLNSPKFDFTQNWSGCKMIKFRQSQALTSHFESFWSIVWWSFTVWKFQNFPITQILREINFWNSRSG